MKKYKSVLLVFVLAFVFMSFLGFNTGSVSAAACAPGEIFNSNTGARCATPATSTDCPSGDLFSSITGLPCTSTTQTSSMCVPLLSREIPAGSRGENVKKLQRFLKAEGYYFGKIDGIYGKRNVKSVKEFQDDNDLPVTGNVDAATLY